MLRRNTHKNVQEYLRRVWPQLWAPSPNPAVRPFTRSLCLSAQASTSSPGHNRSLFVQARPAMRPATSRCQAQAQPAMSQTAGNALATALRLTTYGVHAVLRSPAKTANQTPAGLNLRAGVASWAASRSPPPRGLARMLQPQRQKQQPLMLQSQLQLQQQPQQPTVAHAMQHLQLMMQQHPLRYAHATAGPSAARSGAAAAAAAAAGAVIAMRRCECECECRRQ